MKIEITATNLLLIVDQLTDVADRLDYELEESSTEFKHQYRQWKRDQIRRLVQELLEQTRHQ